MQLFVINVPDYPVSAWPDRLNNDLMMTKNDNTYKKLLQKLSNFVQNNLINK